MNIKKNIALLLCLILVILCGCNGANKNKPIQNGDDSSLTAGGKQINMLYSSKDTLNPYTCVTAQNTVLTQLMYDSLVVLKNDYKTEYEIAKSITYNDKVLVIELDSLVFSDATPLTAADVVFSFNLAKESKAYSSSLAYAVSAEASGTRTVTITLSRDDPYFVNLLTFPIIKSGSDTLTDSDNRLLPPIGTGLYVFNIEEKKLNANNKHTGVTPTVTTIMLTDCPDDEAVNQTLSTGAIDIYFTDLTDNVIPKMNGTTADLPQSRMLFLGVNPKSPRVANVYFRQAVSAALNRSEICTTAYYSKAEAAKGPYPSAWEEVANLQSIEVKPNIDTVHSNVLLAGFGEKNEDGFYVAKNNEPITLTLLASSDNLCRVSAANIIKKNLENAGIKINLVTADNSGYRRELLSGGYDIYLGEVNFHNNLDLGPLVNLNSAWHLLNKSSVISPTTSATNSANVSSVTISDTVVSNLTTADVYKGFYSGTYTVKDLAATFSAELPVIPVCFGSGLLIYSDKLGKGLEPTISDIFYNLENIK